MPRALPETEIEKGIFEVKISPRDLTVSKNEIELTLGYSDGMMPSHFSEMVDVLLSQLSRNCSIAAGYRVVDVSRSPNRVNGLEVGGKFMTMDKIVTGQLKKAEQAALFVCTIGPTMENWSRQLLKEDDIVLGFMVDTIASATAECVTNLLHDHIGMRMEQRGLKITNRYSPGYCNWPVSEQHVLFSLFPQDFCGVTLTESALMLPIKSVSGIVGIGANVERKDYICNRCGVKDCTYRTTRRLETSISKL